MKKSLQLYLTFIFLFTLADNLSAAPFDTGMIELQQPDETTFIGRIWGDEFFWWAETEDGYRFIQSGDGWYYYATLDEDGEFTKTIYKVGIDCSALTQNLFRDVLSIDLMRSARLQFSQGKSVTNKQDLQFGDLVFFNTRQRVKPGHVGIYIDDNLFAHASTSKGVTISSMDLDYYSQRFMGGRRIDSSSLAEEK